MARLFALDVDRTNQPFRIDEIPYDDSGAALRLFNGITIAEGTVVNPEGEMRVPASRPAPRSLGHCLFPLTTATT